MDGIRRGAPDQERVRRRDAKLLDRELAYARVMNWGRLPCPCRIHMRESELTVASYKRCVRENSRHPWFYGATEVRMPFYTWFALFQVNSLFEGLL